MGMLTATPLQYRVADLALAEAEPERFLVVNGELPIEEIHQVIITRVSDLLG